VAFTSASRKHTNTTAATAARQEPYRASFEDAVTMFHLTAEGAGGAS